MTMAHDPTRHWPLGVGPENTSIPGAAWLELLDGQAFPVVGAGAMVWNGTMWVPVSDQNRLPVEATLSGRVVILAFETSVEILPKETYGTSPIKLPYNKTRLILRDRSFAGDRVNDVSVRVGFLDPSLSGAFVFASLIEVIPGDGRRYTAYEFESSGAGCEIDITNNGETTG